MVILLVLVPRRKPTLISVYKNYPIKKIHREKRTKCDTWTPGVIGLAPCGMVPPCKACPVPLTAPWDGGPA